MFVNFMLLEEQRTEELLRTCSLVANQIHVLMKVRGYVFKLVLIDV